METCDTWGAIIVIMERMMNVDVTLLNRNTSIVVADVFKYFSHNGCR